MANPKQDSIISIKEIQSELTEVQELLSTDDKVHFPVKIFAQPVQEIITATNESLDYPFDFVGSAILYSASIGIGSTYRVRVKKAWTEPAIIYLAILGRPGTNKSHPLAWALSPIHKKDAQSYRLYEEQMRYFKEAEQMSKSERDEDGIGELVKPYWIKSLLSDFTPEALVEVHKHNLRGIGIYVDELASWYKSFGRYSKGAEAEFWLSAFNASPVCVDRKGSEPTYISNPFISVIGTMQPSVLMELASGNRSSNGFMDRLLFSYDEDIKTPYWSEKELPDDIPMLWSSIIENLFKYQHIKDEEGKLKSNILDFSKEAKGILYSWQKGFIDEVNTLDNDILSGLYSKLSVYCIRFALILEVLDNAIRGDEPRQINTKAVEGAIELVGYFKAKAIKVRSITDQSMQPIDSYSKQHRDLYDSLSKEFETKEMNEKAKEYALTRKQIFTFLKKGDLFEKVKHGTYKKKY